MTLTAFCDSCGRKIRVGQEYAGKKVKCLHCGHVLILPKRQDFLSDPHMDFAKRSEGKKEEADGEAEPKKDELSDIPPLEPKAPPPVADLHPSPAGSHVEVVDVEPHQSGDLVRGLLFGLGFWLAAVPFLLLSALVVLALTRMFFK